MSRGTKTTVTFAVRGLTCGRCIAEVMEHVQVLPGVRGVAVDLVVGGESPVTIRSRPRASLATVRSVVGEAGFDVVGLWPPGQSQLPALATTGQPSSTVDLPEGVRS